MVVFKDSFRACAIVRELTNPVQHKVDNFLPDGVMSASKIVCCVFFSGNQLFRMEQLAISARSHFINHLSTTHAAMATLHQHFQVGQKNTPCNCEHQLRHFATTKLITISQNSGQSQVSVGSKSTITHRGTCFPAPVSEKNLNCRSIYWMHSPQRNNIQKPKPSSETFGRKHMPKCCPHTRKLASPHPPSNVLKASSPPPIVLSDGI